MPRLFWPNPTLWLEWTTRASVFQLIYNLYRPAEVSDPFQQYICLSAVSVACTVWFIQRYCRRFVATSATGDFPSDVDGFCL